MSLPQELDRHLRDLLALGGVRTVLGAVPTRGPLGMAHLARSPEEVDRFSLSAQACPNLLVHLTSEEARLDHTRFPVAVLVRGCETRMLNQIFSERGLARDPARLCAHQQVEVLAHVGVQLGRAHGPHPRGGVAPL